MFFDGNATCEIVCRRLSSWDMFVGLIGANLGMCWKCYRIIAGACRVIQESGVIPSWLDDVVPFAEIVIMDHPVILQKGFRGLDSLLILLGFETGMDF